MIDGTMLTHAALICGVGIAALIRMSHNDNGRNGLVEVEISRHAAQRMAEMGVNAGDVLRVLRDPQVEYTQPRQGRYRKMAKGGALGVAYDDHGSRYVVITVLWNTDTHVKVTRVKGGAP